MKRKIEKTEFATLSKHFSFHHYALPDDRKMPHGSYEIYYLGSNILDERGFFKHNIHVGLILRNYPHLRLRTTL